MKTKKEVCADKGYIVYDTALPQSWFDMILCELKAIGAEYENPLCHFVWVYQDKTGNNCGLGGIPGAITQQGTDLLKKLDERDDKLEPVSPSLSGMHE